MDTYFEKIDFNSCGISAGNPGPSYLAGIDKCKKHSGVCILLQVLKVYKIPVM